MIVSLLFVVLVSSGRIPASQIRNQVEMHATFNWFCVELCSQLSLDQRKLAQRSERVKSVDLHPTEPWILASLYSGTVGIWNYQSQAS
ncbi:hypothetical protein ZIOFF_054269 [Zingiber officinale]|uniref:Uncharacterized protein n=1 Tax=Zingiber officinale TaxID=94328 RepID=A0A8J5KP77_ZINOF|nr:hypothetical protein ZIOFF_054269 [Zingiber officinale]